MEEGTIANWKKQEGDKISEGDIICEVETDKATMDYESIQEGVLLKILAAEGAEVGVGVPIAIIGEKGEDFSALVQAAGSAAEKKAPVIEESPEPETEKPAAEQAPAPQQKQQPKVPSEDSWIKASPLARGDRPFHGYKPFVSNRVGTGRQNS